MARKTRHDGTNQTIVYYHYEHRMWQFREPSGPVRNFARSLKSNRFLTFVFDVRRFGFVLFVVCFFPQLLLYVAKIQFFGVRSVHRLVRAFLVNVVWLLEWILSFTIYSDVMLAKTIVEYNLEWMLLFVGDSLYAFKAGLVVDRYLQVGHVMDVCKRRIKTGSILNELH